MKNLRSDWIESEHRPTTEASNTYPGHEERVLRHALHVAQFYAANPRRCDTGRPTWRGWVTIASVLRRANGADANRE